MRFSCDKCSARFAIADERIRGKIVAMRCTRCGSRITVNGKSLVLEPAISDLAQHASPGNVSVTPDLPTVETRVLPDGWFIIADGKQTGPHEGPELVAMIQAGRVGPRTYAWRDGQGDWKRAADLALLQPILLRQPAPAASPAPAAGVPPGKEQPAPGPHEQPSGPKKLQTLFDDELDNFPTITGKPIDPALLESSEPTMPTAQLPKRADGPAPALLKSEAAPSADPFANLPDNPHMSKPLEIGEQTRFFMQRAGVTKRNPLWKKALFVFGLIGLPTATLYLLSQLGIATVTQYDEQTGQAVKQPIFSSEGIQGLGEILLGKQPRAAKRAVPSPSAPSPSAPGPGSSPGSPVIARPDIRFTPLTSEERARAEEIYKSGDLKQIGPVRRDVTATHVDGRPGLDDRVVSSTIGKNLKAFQGCNEDELRRDPSFPGGKIRVTLTVGRSGIVTRASIDKPEIERSTLGDCLLDRARRIAFPAFEGEAFDVEVPLILTRGM